MPSMPCATPSLARMHTMRSVLDEEIQHVQKPCPEGRYSNYFEVGCNAFEFLIDFGQHYPECEKLMHTRIVTGPAYAKVLVMTLSASIARFEQTFGPIDDLTESGGDAA